MKTLIHVEDIFLGQFEETDTLTVDVLAYRKKLSDTEKLFQLCIGGKCLILSGFHLDLLGFFRL